MLCIVILPAAVSPANIISQKPRGFSACQKSPSGAFSPSCFQNCKMKFCSIILQFCRCGGLFDAKGNPDGFLSHFSSLRNFRLGSFLTVLLRAKPGISLSFPRAQRTSDFVTQNQYTRFRIVQKEGSTSFALPFFLLMIQFAQDQSFSLTKALPAFPARPEGAPLACRHSSRSRSRCFSRRCGSR